MTTLTPAEIKRQDEVDNAAMDLIIRLAPASKRGLIDWNIEYIGRVVDAVGTVLVDDLGLMTEQEFYPNVSKS